MYPKHLRCDWGRVQAVEVSCSWLLLSSECSSCASSHGLPSRAGSSPTIVPQLAPPPPPIPTGAALPVEGVGIPGVPPDPTLAGAASGLATFTAAEATSYWNTHRIPELGDVMIGGQPV